MTARARGESAGICRHIEGLVFDERLEEARALFLEHASSLGDTTEVRALRGYLAFHAEDYALAKDLLEKVARRRGPLGGRASFYLAGLAHRQGDEAETKLRLGDAIRFGGTTFIARWARDQWADRFPAEEPPAGPKPRSLRPLIVALACLVVMIAAVMSARPIRTAVVTRRLAATFERTTAKKLALAETAIHRGTRGKTDVYFVGGAGWAEQTVFLSEVHAARSAFEHRYDVDGQSILLVNDAAADDDEPMLTNASLRRALHTVGRRMDRDEDVLFLYLTSHGSQEGLALGYADGSRETLEPKALRSMLDDSGVRWRVIVVQGCESGVFLDALANEATIVATAASADRPSYGCADGNDFTDFGRAFIHDRLRTSPSFIDALEAAAEDVRSKDVAEDRLASQPNVRVGDAIRAKLHPDR